MDSPEPPLPIDLLSQAGDPFPEEPRFQRNNDMNETCHLSLLCQVPFRPLSVDALAVKTYEIIESLCCAILCKLSFSRAAKRVDSAVHVRNERRLVTQVVAAHHEKTPGPCPGISSAASLRARNL